MICLIKIKLILIHNGYQIYNLLNLGLNIIKDIYNEKLFGEPFSVYHSNENDIIVDFNNGSTIRILGYHKEERGNRFNDVLINNLIPLNDVNEVIKPKVIIQRPINDRMFYYEM